MTVHKIDTGVEVPVEKALYDAVNNTIGAFLENNKVSYCQLLGVLTLLTNQYTEQAFDD